ncbi:nidogen-1 [Triplophysa dalaica]|uniref:nidogen-1 n=1 Tax=Triplophysa dalaica TaxID=1582913 RepID=UPI0024E01152|nr:nidogen-1 [Triplophysa dalaica]
MCVCVSGLQQQIFSQTPARFRSVMDRQGQRWSVWIIFLGLCVCVSGITRQDLFPFGEGAGDQKLPEGNDETQQISLEKPVTFFNEQFNKIYINTNGFVALKTPAEESEYLGKMPASFGMIAALQGDLDTSDGVGKVFFREDTSPVVLRHAADHINRAFPEHDSVNPSHALVVTWVDVAPHRTERRGDAEDHRGRRNTFQLVIASLESVSWAVLLYPRDGLQVHTTGDSHTLHAGFSKGHEGYTIFSKKQGPYYRITDDTEASITKLAEQTNSGKPGVWVYKIGAFPQFSDVTAGQVPDLPVDSHQYRNTGSHRHQHQVQVYPEDQGISQDILDGVYHRPEHPVLLQVETVQFTPEVVEVESDDNIQVNVFTYNSGQCARHTCSKFGECRNSPSGQCCHCKPGFYGNGVQCVSEGVPQRMNGKMSCRLFVGDSPVPVEISDNDLHSYVVVNDGRAYVAISTIPPSVGFSLQPLSAVGAVIGWAFALQQPGFKNGFSIIGGEFKRQVDVTFQPGGERMTISQEFKGIDEHDHLMVNTKLEGQIPEVPQGAQVKLDPYTEIYQYSSNLITSSSMREYVVSREDLPSVTRSYKFRETITFQGCQHDESSRDVPSTQMLSVDQVFVKYDVSEQLLRYATSNKIGDINGGQPEENPCFTGKHDCDTNAVCRPGGANEFTCECATGFTGEGRACYDVDECRESPQICGPHAICNNQPGTFRCECLDGFQFASDGRTCVEVLRPVDPCQTGTHDCDIPERARCSYTGGSSYICSCLQGFMGDGRTCRDIDECHGNQCHENAFCTNTAGSFTCQCNAGYYGDGYHCSTDGKTRCQLHRENALGSGGAGPRGPRPLPGRFVPTCDAQGEYEPMQCHESIGQCWCVDPDGQEISGSRTGPGTFPDCPDHGPGPVRPTPRPDVSPLPPGSHILFTQSGKVEFVPLDGHDLKKTEAKTALHLPEKVLIGIAYDCLEKMMYWTDISTPAISKASLHGGEPISLITSDLGSPEGIAIDHLGRNMFWTDSMKDRIEVSSLDGSKRRVLIDTGLINPRAILTDPTNGYIYWADWNRESPRIEMAYMDGTNRRILVKDDLGLPNGLTYDPQTSQLCWADAGTHKVECMNPNQGDRRQLMEGLQYPFGMTTDGRNLYYTDWKRGGVVVIDRHTGKEVDEFQPQKQTRLYGITTAHAQCPSGQNYCSVNNGGCTHLCLATPAGRSCRCPDDSAGSGCVEGEGRN